MKNSDLIKKIKFLKGIEPDQYFINNLRRLILVTPQTQSPEPLKGLIFNNLKMGLAFSLAIIITFIILTGVNFKGVYFPYISSLDKHNLKDEWLKSDINVYLTEVSYWQETEKQIGLVLSQVSQNRSNSLNSRSLEKESQLIKEELDSYWLDENEIRNPKINELLDSLL